MKARTYTLTLAVVAGLPWLLSVAWAGGWGTGWAATVGGAVLIGWAVDRA